MEIRWLDVPDTSGWYQVSDTGVVRSVGHWVEYKDGRKPRFFDGVEPLKPFINGGGYEVYTLHLADGDRRVVQAQVLVLEAFVGPRPDGMPHCRHLDGDPSNNHLDNLKYGTYEDNRADMTAHGRDHYAIRTHCKWGHELIDPNLQPDPKNPNKRVCRACNSAGSRFHAYKFDRELNPELFRIVSNWYLERIMAGQVIYKVLKPPMFASMVALAERQKSALDGIPKPREEGE